MRFLRFLANANVVHLSLGIGCEAFGFALVLLLSPHYCVIQQKGDIGEAVLFCEIGDLEGFGRLYFDRITSITEVKDEK